MFVSISFFSLSLWFLVIKSPSIAINIHGFHRTQVKKKNKECIFFSHHGLEKRTNAGQSGRISFLLTF